MGCDSNPEDVAQRLFRRDSFSFFRGQIGAWRDVFTSEHVRLAQDRFAEVLRMYGYSRCPSPWPSHSE